MLRWAKLGSKDTPPAAAPAGTSAAGGGTSTDVGAVDGGHHAFDNSADNTDVDRMYGMENFGNTCYCNSVLQALYFCRPFRDCITTYPLLETPFIPETLPRPSTFLVPPPASVSPSVEKTLSSAMTPSSASNAPPPSEKKTSRWNVTKKSSAAAPAPVVAPTSPASDHPGGPNGGLEGGVPTQVIAPQSTGPPPASLFLALQTLFRHIAAIGPPMYQLPPPDKDGKQGPPVQIRTVVAPAAFVGKLKLENEMFRGTMQQDAHEFLNYLLNKIGEDLGGEERVRREAERKRILTSSVDELSASLTSLSTQPSGLKANDPEPTFVHKLFQGTLTNETRCLTCETTSSRDESFLDLSIDIEQNTSITACLRQFSASETLCQRNKFYCDTCCGLQEAEKRMKVKTLPNILALHLKRFKYQEDLGRYVKLNYRVVFPFTLRLFNTSDDTEDPDRLYELFAIVVHVGSGPHHGHYIAIVRTGSGWTMFDDETVTPIDENEIHKYFGENAAGSGYVLFYQALDLDPAAVGLREREATAAAASTVNTTTHDGLGERGFVFPAATTGSLKREVSEAALVDPLRTQRASSEEPDSARTPVPGSSPVRPLLLTEPLGGAVPPPSASSPAATAVTETPQMNFTEALSASITSSESSLGMSISPGGFSTKSSSSRPTPSPPLPPSPSPAGAVSPPPPPAVSSSPSLTPTTVTTSSTPVSSIQLSRSDDGSSSSQIRSSMSQNLGSWPPPPSQPISSLATATTASSVPVSASSSSALLPPLGPLSSSSMMSPAPPPSGAKEKESSSGGWFSRRSGKDKDKDKDASSSSKIERRTSGRTASWYGSLSGAGAGGSSSSQTISRDPTHHQQHPSLFGNVDDDLHVMRPPVRPRQASASSSGSGYPESMATMDSLFKSTAAANGGGSGLFHHYAPHTQVTTVPEDGRGSGLHSPSSVSSSTPTASSGAAFSSSLPATSWLQGSAPSARQPPPMLHALTTSLPPTAPSPASAPPPSKKDLKEREKEESRRRKAERKTSFIGSPAGHGGAAAAAAGGGGGDKPALTSVAGLKQLGNLSRSASLMKVSGFGFGRKDKAEKNGGAGEN